MSEQKQVIPRLGLVDLSSYVADLILVGAGEREAIRHSSTRRAWHVFFFSLIAFLIWHVTARVALVPSLPGNLGFAKWVRVSEAAAYCYLICTLGVLAYRHYRHILVPGKQSRLLTLGFFFTAAVWLFARLNYSLFNHDASLFKVGDASIVPAGHFGLYGYRDLRLAIEFLCFSCCAMINGSYPNLQPASVITSTISIAEALVGYAFFAVLIGTFVQVSSRPSPEGKGSARPHQKPQS